MTAQDTAAGAHQIALQPPNPANNQYVQAIGRIYYTDATGTHGHDTQRLWNGGGGSSDLRNLPQENGQKYLARAGGHSMNRKCAEMRVLRQLDAWLRMHRGAQNVHIRLYTSKSPCIACERDIATFHNRFPGVELVVRSLGDYTLPANKVAHQRAPTLGTQVTKANVARGWHKFQRLAPNPAAPHAVAGLAAHGAAAPVARVLPPAGAHARGQPV